jgi:hypothetical protein
MNPFDVAAALIAIAAAGYVNYPYSPPRLQTTTDDHASVAGSPPGFA